MCCDLSPRFEGDIGPQIFITNNNNNQQNPIFLVWDSDECDGEGKRKVRSHDMLKKMETLELRQK